MPDALFPRAWVVPELPLFSSEPLWLTEPETPIERRFAEFHHANPQVFDRLRMLALNALKRGEQRLGIANLVEYLRRDQETRGEPYRLNNSFRSLYARLLVHHHPELETLIEIRQRREKIS